MQPRSDKSLVDRFLDWWRGLWGQSPSSSTTPPSVSSQSPTAANLSSPSATPAAVPAPDAAQPAAETASRSVQDRVADANNQIRDSVSGLRRELEDDGASAAGAGLAAATTEPDAASNLSGTTVAGDETDTAPLDTLAGDASDFEPVAFEADETIVAVEDDGTIDVVDIEEAGIAEVPVTAGVAEAPGDVEAGLEDIGDLSADELGTLEDQEGDLPAFGEDASVAEALETSAAFPVDASEDLAGDFESAEGTAAGLGASETVFDAEDEGDAADAASMAAVEDAAVPSGDLAADDVATLGEPEAFDDASAAAAVATTPDDSTVGSATDEQVAAPDDAGDVAGTAESLDYIGLFGRSGDVEVTDLSYLDDDDNARFDFSTAAAMGASEPAVDIAADASEAATATLAEPAGDADASAAETVSAAASNPADSLSGLDEDAAASVTDAVGAAEEDAVGATAAWAEPVDVASSDAATGVADGSVAAGEPGEQAGGAVASEADAEGGLVAAGVATAAVAQQRTASDEAGRVRGDASGACPVDYPIKGKSSSKVFHTPELPSYQGTKADWCFATETDAIAAGYRAPGGQRGRAAAGAGAGPAAAAVTAPAEDEAAHTEAVIPAPLSATPVGEENFDAGSLADTAAGAYAEEMPESAAELSVVPPLEDDSFGAMDETVETGVFGTVPESASIDQGDSLAGDESWSSSAVTDAVDEGGDDIASLESPPPDDLADTERAVAEADEAAGDSQVAAEDGYANAVRGDGTKVCPAGYPVKGNASSMIYHVPGRASYEATIGEWCFASEEAAQEAGFRAPKR